MSLQNLQHWLGLDPCPLGLTLKVLGASGGEVVCVMVWFSRVLYFLVSQRVLLGPAQLFTEDKNPS